MSPRHFAAMPTPNGHTCGDAASAMQKSIRRGLERDAIYWASELDLAGFANYVWKRLRLIASEDVGLADSNVAVQVRVLYDNWREISKNSEGKPNQPRLFLVHALILLCRAPKSRVCDHAMITFYLGDRDDLYREVPDYAYDRHTRKGKQLGRGVEHFMDESSQLVNAVGRDPYRRTAREVLMEQEATPRRRRRNSEDVAQLAIEPLSRRARQTAVKAAEADDHKRQKQEAAEAAALSGEDE